MKPHGELITGGGRHDQISVNGSAQILTSGICVSIARLCFSSLLRVFFIGGVDVCCVFHLSVGQFGVGGSCVQPSLESCRMWKL